MGGKQNPEEDWEPRGCAQQPVARELAELLAPVTGGAPIEAVEQLVGGLVNLNLRVRAGRGDWVLRVFASGAEVAAKELALHRLLEGKTPLADLVHAGTTSARDGARPFAVHRFIAGVKLTEVLATEGDLEPVGRAVGSVLAAVHSVHFREAGFLGADAQIARPLPGIREAWEGYLLECLSGRAGERLGSAATAGLRALVAAEGSRLDGLAPPFTLCHADYKPTNLLMRRDGASWAVAAVLDWEFAFAFTGLFDLGQMLRWRARYPASFAAGLAEGYAASARLPEDWQRTAELIDLMNLVGFLESEAERPRVFADVKSRIAATLA